MQRKVGTAAALVLMLGALALALAAAAPAADVNVTCVIVAGGPAGPAGDVLKVVDTSQSVTHIDREGDEIVVSNNADSDRAVCAGGTPTVTDIDSIEYTTASGVPFIGYHSDGPLGPGASPEPGGGAEIEISVAEVYDSPVLNVGATTGDDSVQAGQLGKGKIGVNLNAQAEAGAEDADITILAKPGAESYLRVLGRGGDDRLTALGGPAFTAPLAVKRLNMVGGPGDDRLTGGPGRDFFSGDDGNDLLLGGRNRDRLLVGPGHDVAKGGKGADDIENRSSVGGIPDDLAPDLLIGGPGNDSIDALGGLPGDRVDCGAGARDGAGLNPGYYQQGCERVEIFRF